MTNGRGAAMASFMTKKKKYKFQVDISLEELLEVPFVSAVLFAKLRLLDGGNFQDNSSREEVKDHKVKWGAKFSFPCKMMANASNGVMERCILRISIRKESKGGRSFNKLGFVDLNLAEYAGAGVIHKKALLEGYDTRHRQDNSMLRFTITMNMLSGDILFKVPSPSLKHKQVAVEEIPAEHRPEEFSGGSLAGSVASGSSGFGSLPKKRPALLTSDLVKGQTLPESVVPVTVLPEPIDPTPSQQPSAPEQEENSCEPGHSRNSSNTSQLSKASGYSSIHSHSHSRQSSSGDSGHIRDLHHRSVRLHPTPNHYSQKLHRTYTFPKRFTIPHTVSSSNEETFSTPQGQISPLNFVTKTPIKEDNKSQYFTPCFRTQTSEISASSNDEYQTPDCSLKTEEFSQNFNELKKSHSASTVDRMKPKNILSVFNDGEKQVPNVKDSTKTETTKHESVLRSQSAFQIPILQVDSPSSAKSLSDSLFSFLTPRPKRKSIGKKSTPESSSTNLFCVPSSPIPKLKGLFDSRTTSLNSLSTGCAANDGLTVAHAFRRNPSSSSLALSETGSLDRAKAAYERRKKVISQESESVPGRVEVTRVNTDDLIEELLKNTNLDQADDSSETSGLQLFIAKDGTAALGNHEVKSQMSTGVQVFKQVVMDDR